MTGPRFRGRCTRHHPRIGDLTHTPIIKIPPQWKRVLTFAPPQVVPLSPAERLGIAVARLGKGGSSQSGTTSSNPPSSSEESCEPQYRRRSCPAPSSGESTTNPFQRLSTRRRSAGSE